MNSYQGNKGPTNNPCHAVEHLLYDVVVQGLPKRGGMCQKGDKPGLITIFFEASIYDICTFSPVKYSQEKTHQIY